MTLSPIARTRLFALAGAIVAVVLGAQIAQESFFWASVCVGAMAALIVARVQSLPLDTVTLGLLLVGYIVGNRGFAQFSFSGSFPLLPAEMALLVMGAILAVDSAYQRKLPWRHDTLNFTLLVWMLAGTIRALFGARAYGFATARDYALVYYAGFFFLAQRVSSDPGSLKFLRQCLLIGCALLLVIHPLFSQFQDFFIGNLTLRGVPLIFYKDDLAGNFMAMGSLLFFVQFEQSKNWGWLLVSLALAGLMLATNSRSSMVGLAVGAGWLALGGRWRFGLVLAASGVVAAVLIFIAAHFRNQSLQQTPLQSVYERTLSIIDPQGQRSYQTDDTSFKGDNNVFRMVWWRAAIDEAVENNVWFGLGFGYDLADRFVRQYFPESSEDFTARSPHNVLITIFARLGIVGSAAFLAFLAVFVRLTFRAVRSPASDPTERTLWCAGWVMFTCACFGVVLEGPMGAVVFWTVLGLANAARAHAAEEDPSAPATVEAGEVEAVPSLPIAGRSA